MSYIIELLNKISAKMENCESSMEYLCLEQMGNHLVEDLMTLGYDEVEMPKVFQRPQILKGKTKCKKELNSLNKDLKNLGSDDYLDYTLNYVKNQPSKDFMNKPATA